LSICDMRFEVKDHFAVGSGKLLDPMTFLRGDSRLTKLQDGGVAGLAESAGGQSEPVVLSDGKRVFRRTVQIQTQDGVFDFGWLSSRKRDAGSWHVKGERGL